MKVYISGQKRGVTDSIKRALRRRSAVKPVTGRAKGEHRMGRNFLKGTHGDAANAVLAAAGYNFRRLLACRPLARPRHGDACGPARHPRRRSARKPEFQTAASRPRTPRSSRSTRLNGRRITAGVHRRTQLGWLAHAAAVRLRAFSTYHLIASFNPSPTRCVGS